MTKKKERQKLAREIRKNVKGALSYPECHSLAKALFTDSFGARAWADKRGFQWEYVPYCPCCGPSKIYVQVRDRVIIINHLYTSTEPPVYAKN